jgi:hypothetical protein
MLTDILVCLPWRQCDRPYGREVRIDDHLTSGAQPILARRGLAKGVRVKWQPEDASAVGAFQFEEAAFGRRRNGPVNLYPFERLLVSI